jgi:hypothetical protein
MDKRHNTGTRQATSEILHHQGQALQYRDKDDTMNNQDEKMRNERMPWHLKSPEWRRTQPYYI